jgi:hypothetical protein
MSRQGDVRRKPNNEAALILFLQVVDAKDTQQLVSIEHALQAPVLCDSQRKQCIQVVAEVVGK